MVAKLMQNNENDVYTEYGYMSERKSAKSYVSPDWIYLLGLGLGLGPAKSYEKLSIKEISDLFELLISPLTSYSR